MLWPQYHITRPHNWEEGAIRYWEEGLGGDLMEGDPEEGACVAGYDRFGEVEA